MTDDPQSGKRSIFCGRAREMAMLREAFARISGPEPEPQLVVLLAESGLGKTRIAQEFYNWLSTEHDGVGGAGYWPDVLAVEGQNLTVNPPLHACNNATEIPFLWWGVRLADPAGRNQAVTCSLTDAIAKLKPHLQPLLAASQRKQRWAETGKSGGRFLRDAVLDHSGVSFVLGGAETVLELLQTGKAEAESWRRKSLDTLQGEQNKTIVDKLILDLATIFGTRAKRKIPAIILFDDAQFSGADEAAVLALQALLERAFAEQWPLLILVTHWEEEWRRQSEQEKPPTIARAIAQLQQPALADWEAYAIGKVDDLAPVLNGAFPGSSPDQRAAILARADGNPRYLDEIIRFASRPAFFEDRDMTRAMTADGLGKIMGASTALRNLIRLRLEDDPPAVRHAVSLGSMQGAEFLRTIVEQLGARLGVEGVSGGLDEAENPHGYVNGGRASVVRFVQGVYREVAAEFLDDDFDRPDVTAKLREIVFARLQDETMWRGLDPSERRQTVALARALMSDDAPQADILARALVRDMRAADEAGDIWAAANDAEALVALLESADSLVVETDWLFYACGALDAVSRNEAAASAMDRAITLLERRQASETDADTVNLATAFVFRGNARDELEDGAGAIKDYGAAINLLEALKARLGTSRPPACENVLSAAYMNRGTARQGLGESAEAVADYGIAIDLFQALKARLGASWPPAFENDLGKGYMNRGGAQISLGDRMGAVAEYGAAINLMEALRVRLGSSWPPAFGNALSVAYMARGVALDGIGNGAGAVADYGIAINLHEALKARLGASWPPAFQTHLASAYMNRGTARQGLGESAEAVADYGIAIDLFQALKARLGASWPPSFENDLAGTYMNRGIARKGLGNWKEAIADYGAAINLLQTLKARLDTSWPPAFEKDLAGAYMNRGNMLDGLGDGAGAVGDHGAAIDLMEALKARLGAFWQSAFENSLSAAYMNRGNARDGLEDAAGAVADYGVAIDLMEALKARLGAHWPPEFENDLAAAYMNRGTTRDGLGDGTGAIADYGAAINLREALKARLGASWTPAFENGLSAAYMNRGVAREEIGDRPRRSPITARRSGCARR